VLPGAEAIEVYTEHREMPFIALTTAVHDDAPPILKWDPRRRAQSVCLVPLSPGLDVA